MIAPATLTAPQAARRLGVSNSTLRRLITRGIVSATHCAAGYRVAHAEIDRVRQLPGWGRVCPSEIC